MTLEEAIAKIDDLRPNKYKHPQKIDWLSELDGKIYNEIISHYESDVEWEPYSEQTDSSIELLVGEPYSNIYEYWLASKIDWWNGEMSRYNNDMIQFNTLYQEFGNYWNKNHKHKGKQLFRL